VRNSTSATMLPWKATTWSREILRLFLCLLPRMGEMPLMQNWEKCCFIGTQTERSMVCIFLWPGEQPVVCSGTQPLGQQAWTLRPPVTTAGVTSPSTLRVRFFTQIFGEVHRGHRNVDAIAFPMKFAFRQLVKSPGFTVIALITLALGIGVNTTAFTVLNRLLFLSQPYPESGRMVQIWSTTPQSQNGAISPGDFCDLREQNTVFSHLSVYTVDYYKSMVAAGHTPEQVTAMAVTADFFPALAFVPPWAHLHSGGAGQTGACGRPVQQLLEKPFGGRSQGARALPAL